MEKTTNWTKISCLRRSREPEKQMMEIRMQLGILG